MISLTVLNPSDYINKGVSEGRCKAHFLWQKCQHSQIQLKLSVSMSYILFYSTYGTVSQYSDHYLLLDLRLAQLVDINNSSNPNSPSTPY